MKKTKYIITSIILLCAAFICNAQSITDTKSIDRKGDQDAPKGKPAARVGDMHTCPLVTPGIPPVPHVGGPVLPPGCPTVLIGGKPAARMGDMASCAGPPDQIIIGSATVLIGGQPAARMGDQTAHGGQIIEGFPLVLIGP